MKELSFNFTLNETLESGVKELTEALKNEVFGVLTRINFDQKIKKIG